MFDLSFGKLAIIFALCLMVLGPEKLPRLAAQLGRFAGQARAMARHFRSQLEQEIAAEDLKKELRIADEAIAKIAAQTAPIQDAVADISNSIDSHVSGMQAAADAATKPLGVANLGIDSTLGLDAAADAAASVTPASTPAAPVQLADPGADKTTTHPSV